MTNKLVVIINILQYQKFRKCYCMKWNFLYQITAASRTPWLRGYRPQIPVLSVLCPQLNFLNPPPSKKIPGYATELNWRKSSNNSVDTVQNEKNIPRRNREGGVCVNVTRRKYCDVVRPSKDLVGHRSIWRRQKRLRLFSMFHRSFFNSITDKTPTPALFIQH